MRSMNASVVKLWAILGLMAMLLGGAGIMFAVGATQPPHKKTDPHRGGAELGGAKADAIVWKEKTVLETPGWLPGSIAYSPDGMALALGGTGGKVIAFTTATLKEKWTADVGGNFAAVAFAADGKSVLATFRDGVRFLDSETGKVGTPIEEVNALADSRSLAVGALPH